MKGRNEKEERNDAERESGLRGRDSIKRTHINESFQGKTELYVGAGMSVHTVCEHVRIQTNIVEGSQLQAQLHRGGCIYNEYPDRTFSLVDPCVERFVWIAYWMARRKSPETTRRDSIKWPKRFLSVQSRRSCSVLKSIRVPSKLPLDRIRFFAVSQFAW